MAIGKHVLDLSVVWHLFDGPLMANVAKHVFTKRTLNDFMALSHESWHEVRERLKEILSKDFPTLRDDKLLREEAIVPLSEVTMHLPANIGKNSDCITVVSMNCLAR